MPWKQRAAVGLLGLACITGARADSIHILPVIEVGAGSADTFGQSAAASQGTVTATELAHRPLSRPGETLETIPGLIVTQHSGNGKANQYFLRGFNLDHGTDFSLSLDGMPLNMPTHGHGQGYADANFLIPELIAAIDYRKGSYFADAGDFSAAGAANVRYSEKLAFSRGELALGEDGYRRAFVAGSPETSGGRLLYALEIQRNDGPWDLPEDLDKLNGVLRYSTGDARSGWNVTAMAYRNAWQSTDQVPLRAIESGLIGRFGHIDPSDGGKTHRFSLSGSWHASGANTRSEAHVYFIDYRLQLFSNFTYFVDDPVIGDQFEQLDDRRVFGGAWSQLWVTGDVEHTVGVQARHDAIDAVGLFNTSARARTSTVRLDKVEQTSAAVYYQAALSPRPWLRLIPGVRADFYRFDVASDTAANSGQAHDHIVSPKFAAVFGPWAKTEFYLNAGRGFHSNDARGVTITVDPASGLPADRVDPLVAATGYEIGLRTRPMNGFETAIALFQLDLDSELLFVGDAGATEASRPSQRRGIEWSSHWHPARNLSFNIDLTWSRARFTDSDPAGNRIPGAIERTVSVGAMYDTPRWFAGARLRYFGARPLTEDNSVRSAASTLVNLETGVRLTRQLEVAMSIFNMFDSDVSDIDYFYASQLAGEPSPVDDIHIHPAEPRTLRLALSMRF
ncbi:MAG: TonB-dependent receptor [Thiobacillus sp.]|nr:TonB-dependent receptor [Thiobacillus sp.]